MTITKTKSDTAQVDTSATANLMKSIFEEVLNGYEASHGSEEARDAINEGFQKALDELHKIGY
tara:strand:- start:125 stop:313 length:189 start_codon:yes stop_codon:yes gene_type:complete